MVSFEPSGTWTQFTERYTKNSWERWVHEFLISQMLVPFFKIGI